MDLQTFRRWPKVDLHRHLEGALRVETLWELAQRATPAPFPSRSALEACCTVGGARPGFRPFLACFDALRFHYGALEILERLAAEAVEDAANDGVVHLELRFSPVFFARRLKPAPPPGVVPPPDSRHEVAAVAERIMAGAKRTARARGLSLAFIVTLGRHMGADVNRPAAELLAERAGDDLAALDLAGDEAVPAAPFAAFFKRWKDAGRKLTIHAGEDPQGPGAANVREAIEEWGADRIGHGLRAAEDPELVAMLARKRIPLELCPTSNLQTHASASAAAHPLRAFLAANVCATINTDDPAVSPTTLSGEYHRAATELGLSLRDLQACQRNACEAAFVPESRRAELRALIQQVR